MMKHRWQRLKLLNWLLRKQFGKKKPKPKNDNKIVNIRVDYGEIEIGKKVREAGGKWNRAKKVWELLFSDVAALNLESRIIGNN